MKGTCLKVINLFSLYLPTSQKFHTYTFGSINHYGKCIFSISNIGNVTVLRIEHISFHSNCLVIIGQPGLSYRDQIIYLQRPT